MCKPAPKTPTSNSESTQKKDMHVETNKPISHTQGTQLKECPAVTAQLRAAQPKHCGRYTSVTMKLVRHVYALQHTFWRSENFEDCYDVCQQTPEGSEGESVAHQPANHSGVHASCTSSQEQHQPTLNIRCAAGTVTQARHPPFWDLQHQPEDNYTN
jgi:hypothetical protein